MKNNHNNYYDYIIAGAGISGLFAAWRILNDAGGLKPRILMLESLGRTGGRLQTTTVNIGGVQVKDEEGGMRFNESMTYINKLIGDLNLPKDSFLMGDGNNRLFFRGKPFTRAQTPFIWSMLYDLTPSERGRSQGDIIIDVMNEIMGQHANRHYKFTDNIPVGPDEWQTFRNKCVYKGIAINNWGFWALMRAYGLSEECVTWLEKTIGFMGPTQSCINAGESLQIILDFPNVPKFYTLRDGFDSTANALVEELTAAGVTINLKESVTHVSCAGAAQTVVTGNDEYTCGKLILAIPHRPLKELVAASPHLRGSKQFEAAMNSVQNMELSKVGLYFSERWWHKAPYNVSCGPSFTDMPLGSVYCFQQYPADPAADAAYNGPAALTIYTDYDRGNFWKEMQHLGKPYEGSIPQPVNTYKASSMLVEEAMRQIGLLFGVPDNVALPDPVLSTYRIWGQEPFGYGYHQYLLGVDDTTDVYPHIYNPAPNVFVCNESWSPEQGWVEGALIATDYMLTKGLNLPSYINDTKHKTNHTSKHHESEIN